MRRRRFLGTAAVGLFSGATGCLDAVAGGDDDPPAIPDGMTVETRHWVDDVLKDGIWNGDHEEYSHRYALLASQSAADSRLADDAESDGFVRETDFTESYVVIAQNLMQSARWLELSGIQRTDAGIEVTVLTEEPDDPYGDDAAPHSLAIRVTDEVAGVPEELVVWLDGERAEN